jgi:hypothetical protein
LLELTLGGVYAGVEGAVGCGVGRILDDADNARALLRTGFGGDEPRGRGQGTPSDGFETGAGAGRIRWSPGRARRRCDPPSAAASAPGPVHYQTRRGSTGRGGASTAPSWNRPAPASTLRAPYAATRRILYGRRGVWGRSGLIVIVVRELVRERTRAGPVHGYWQECLVHGGHGPGGGAPYVLRGATCPPGLQEAGDSEVAARGGSARTTETLTGTVASMLHVPATPPSAAAITRFQPAPLL